MRAGAILSPCMHHASSHKLILLGMHVVYLDMQYCGSNLHIRTAHVMIWASGLVVWCHGCSPVQQRLYHMAR